MRLLLVENVKDHEGVKYLLESLDLEIRKIEDQLLTADSVALPDRERDRAIDRKKIYERVIGYFDTSRLVDIEQEVDKNI